MAKGALVKLAVSGLLLAAVALVFTYRDSFDIAAIENWVEQQGAAGPLMFMLLYAIGAVLFLPGSLLTLLGGALFGPYWGTLYNLTGATLGAVLAFLIARYLAGDWVASKAGGKLKQMVDGVESEGWRFVAFTRLVPLFPFNLLNFALGLTRIPLSQYLIATYICMLPGAFAYTWLGYAGKEAASGAEGLVQTVLIALALLVSVAFLPRLIARMRQNPWLTIDELRHRMSKRIGIVLDVRSPQEFEGELGHLEGAINIPLDQLQSRLDELGDNYHQPIAIVCHTDRRSAKAATMLAKSGFTETAVVRGGMVAWSEQSLPVEH